MKKLQDNLAARIAASVILTVSFLLTLLSTAGIVLLASYQAYNDGGAQLRTSYLHAAGVQEYYDHVEPVLEGLVHEPQSYQNYLNSLNVHVDVKTTDGTTVFSNAKEGETSLLEGPFSYTFTTGETKLWKNTFSDAEKAQRALERFPYQIEDYEIEASPFEYSTSYSPIDESLGDALDETLSGLESYYPMLKIWYYPEGSLSEVEVGVTLAAAPIGNDSVAVTARWIDLLIAMRVWLILILVLSAACCVASFAFRLRTAGHKRGTAGITLRWLDRMPFEAYLLALAAVVLIIVFLASAKGELWSIAPAAVLLCFLLQTLPMTIAARCKAHTMWRNTLLRRLLDCIPGVLRRLAAVIRRVMPKLPLVWTALVCWLSLSLLELGFLMAGAYAVLWIVEKVVFTPLVVLFLLDLRRLLDGSKRLAEGDLDHSVATDHMFSPLRRQANYLNGIRDGMRNAVEERMQSERMKTELITNVSHDIKTPLTSIVNYAGLLQRDGLSSPDAPEYLEVLVRQSTRLKKLTEDLIEASKAATGNLTVHPEAVDAHVLLGQAEAEYADRLQNAKIEPVFDLRAQRFCVQADGRLLWRVFDNLLSNICKYGLPGSRAYLRTEERGELLRITFLNISRDALNIPAVEEAFAFGLAVFADGGFELAEQLLLLARELGRRLDDDGDELVAARLVADVGDALAAQAEGGAGLRALGDLVADLAVERRDLDGCAERGLREGDGHLAHDIRAVTREDRVLAHRDRHEQIAVRAAVRAGVALVAHAEGLAVVDAGRDLDLDGLGVADLALAAAGGAGVGDDGTGAAALRARLRGLHGHAHEVLLRAHGAGAVAIRTGLRGRAFLRAGAVAGAAGLDAGEGDLALAAEGRVFKADLDLADNVLALARPSSAAGG